MDKYIAEFLGTGFLFCAVVGSGIMAENLSTGDQALILLINTIATFFALYFLITAFNSFSNHFNPIVSFVIYLDQKISLTTLMIFIFLQISGAIAGVLAANYMFGIENFEFSQKDRSGLNSK